MKPIHTQQIIGVYPSLTHTRATQSLTIEQWFNAIKTGKHDSIIKTIRSGGNKDGLPLVTPAGAFAERRYKQGCTAASGIVFVDVDGKENPNIDWPAARAKMATDPAVVACWISSRGNGLHIFFWWPYILPLTRAEATESYRAAYDLSSSRVKNAGMVVDSHASDISRLCYLSSDTDAYIRQAQPVPLDRAETASVSALSTAQAQTPTPAKTTDWLGNITQIEDASDEQILSALAVISADVSYPEWYKVACALSHETSGKIRGYKLFDTWSRNGKKYDEPATQKCWESIDPSPSDRAPITIASLWAMARAAKQGWEKPAKPSDELAQKRPIDRFWRCGKEYYWLDYNGGYTRLTTDGLKRVLVSIGLLTSKGKNETQSPADKIIKQIDVERTVDFVGPVAGLHDGPQEQCGTRILVTKGVKIYAPKEGAWDTIRQVLGMFGQREQDWLHQYTQLSYKLLTTGANAPAPCLVFRGPKACGKTLYTRILTEIFGGRQADASAYAFGDTAFNAELVGAEMLVLDDCNQATADARSRLGAFIKTKLFGSTIQAHAKNRDGVPLRPFWRMAILLNDDDESAGVLPPVVDGMRDKLAMFHCWHSGIEIDPLKRDEFWERIKNEIPGYLYWLLNTFVAPKNVIGPRTGLAEMLDPGALAASISNTDAEHLWCMLERMVIGEIDPREITSVDIFEKMDQSLRVKWSTAKIAKLLRLIEIARPDRLVCMGKNSNRVVTYRYIPASDDEHGKLVDQIFENTPKRDAGNRLFGMLEP